MLWISLGRVIEGSRRWVSETKTKQHNTLQPTQHWQVISWERGRYNQFYRVQSHYIAALSNFHSIAPYHTFVDTDQSYTAIPVCIVSHVKNRYPDQHTTHTRNLQQPNPARASNSFPNPSDEIHATSGEKEGFPLLLFIYLHSCWLALFPTDFYFVWCDFP